MGDNQGWIVVFDSTHQVLLGEKVLKENRVRAEVIPLPRRFTADCGLALKIDNRVRCLVQEVLSSCKVKYKGIYDLAE